VTVDRAFPHTLEVGVTEYVPAAYALAGTRWYVVAENGYVICTATEAADQLGSAGKTAKAAATPDPSAPSDPSSASTDATAATDATGTTATTETAGESGGLTGRLVAGPPGAELPLPRMAVKGRVREGAVLDDEVTAQKLAVITALPNSFRRRLAAVEDKDGRLTLRFDGGPVAEWGDAERTLAKTVALRTVLAAYADAGKTCTQIDVSIPDRTLAKPVLQ
jgi:hypothetical protein